MIADLAWNFALPILGGHNAFSILRAHRWNDLICDNSIADWNERTHSVTGSLISTSRHGIDVSLIYVSGGRQAQLEHGVRSEIVRAFHAGLIEWEMLSKKPYMAASRCDPRSRPKAQLQTWTNVLHAPLNQRIKCLSRPWSRPGMIHDIFSLLFCLPLWYLDLTQENFLTDDQEWLLAITRLPGRPHSQLVAGTFAAKIRLCSRKLGSVVTQTALASYISLDIGHLSLLLHSDGAFEIALAARRVLLPISAVFIFLPR